MNNDFPTGACMVFGGSGGIGQGVAMEFARAGTDVAICYRSKADVAEKVAADIRALGGKASIHKVDVTDAAAVAAAIYAAAAEHGRVHTVVWGAGPLVNQTPIAEWSGEEFRTAVEVELFGFYNAVRAVLPHMRSQGGGSFVHLGSGGHWWYPKLDGLSVVPKASNEALIKGIAKEEGEYNIRANSVLVGVIDAGMFRELTAQGQLDAKWVEETHKLLCLRRWGQPEDIGAAAVFFASNKANYITGQTLSVSGGFGV